jgi:ABC-2 type transport system permease protein
MNRSDKYLTLVRREFWEHRSLWMWPVGISVFLLLASTAVSLFAHGKIELHGPWVDGTVDTRGAAAMGLGVFGVASQVLGITALVCGLYLVDCLYAERKDRSILFWKSMPVSDTVTVLTKLAVALLVVPLLGFLLVTLIYPAIYGISAIGVPAFSQASGGWNSLAWLRAEGSLLLALLVSTLWYAPLAAWAMLFSVLSTRLPLLSALAPVLAAGICESVLFQTTHVWRFLRERITPFMDGVAGIQRLDLWLGLAVAAAMMLAVIRLRRYRDDT